MNGIKDVLGFEYVNLSLVELGLNQIKTEYVIGLKSAEEIERFKRQAIHSLDSNDIQADIVRSREIEVPAINDSRFDQPMYREFRHDRLVRVFVPMIESFNKRVIGTIEAGYRRTYRKHIYERDVQILESFVDYATQALEQRQSGLLEKISHEFKTPIVGIRSNASFLKKRIDSLPPDFINRKFDDIVTDCAILLYQVGELEYFLGRPPRKPKMERISYRDIFIKTVKQLTPVLFEYGFSDSKIDYNSADRNRILYTDKAMLNQVVYNLLMNSIKYAEKDPALFSVRLEIEETRRTIVIKFKDWGIGVEEMYRDKIFEYGFRTPDAKSKNVSGSGLGLTISRSIMRQLGGDLRLENCRKPTAFHLILPKDEKENRKRFFSLMTINGTWRVFMKNSNCLATMWTFTLT